MSSLARLLTENCVQRLTWSSILYMKLANGIQLNVAELSMIAACVVNKTPCSFLIFGLGNDSLFWSTLNQNGQTYFLEDNPGWFQKVRNRHPELQASLVHYNTRRSQWRELLQDPTSLWLPVPLRVADIKWDIILVDAPNGWRDAQAGRMKSIYMASELIKRGGDVFVHDCNRMVEAVYTSRFLGEKNLLASVGRLRHYQFEKIDPEANRKYREG